MARLSLAARATSSSVAPGFEERTAAAAARISLRETFMCLMRQFYFTAPLKSRGRFRREAKALAALDQAGIALPAGWRRPVRSLPSAALCSGGG